MNSKNDDPAYDVVVIGCGLAGAAVANLLGQLNLRTLVLERDDQLYPSPVPSCWTMKCYASCKLWTWANILAT